MPKTNLEKCCDSCKDLEILAAHTLCSCHQKTHSKEQTFEEKWLAIDEKTWLERSQHPDLQTVLAFFKTEVSELLGDFQERKRDIDKSLGYEHNRYDIGNNDMADEAITLTKQRFGL